MNCLETGQTLPQVNVSHQILVLSLTKLPAVTPVIYEVVDMKCTNLVLFTQ